MAACVTTAALVVVYYFWAVRAAGKPFEWGADLNGYYDLLARGFLSGHLYLPLPPSPKLLALPNPWDPSVDDSLKWQDMVLYGNRYYLYFGAAPAVLVFAPFRLLARHDLPENFAIFLLCSGGFLFFVGSLLRVLKLASAAPGPLLLAFMVLALGVCQSVPFLLNRVAVYEIAIAGGYFCIAAAVFFLVRGLGPSAGVYWMALSGLMFGGAVACRPHLMFPGFVALVGLALYEARVRSRKVLYFALAFALTGVIIATYNYERFGNPLEFGFRYQLAGPGQNRVEPAVRNLIPGLYFMLLSRPELGATFPWMRMVFRFPFDSAVRHPLPPDYFVEPTVGALWIAPLIVAALFIPAARGSPERSILGITLASSGAVLLFLMLSHLATHRYEVDFLPLAVFTAIANVAVLVSRRTGGKRRLFAVLAGIAIVYSAVANLALGIQGPYDDVLRNRPARYVRIAGWFSPWREYRPSMDPDVAIDLTAQCSQDAMGFREPLVTMGHSHFNYFLFAERAGNGVRLVSQSEESQQSVEVPDPWSHPFSIHLEYSAATHKLTVDIEGQHAIEQPINRLVTSPAEVVAGENFSDLGLTARRFTGPIRLLIKSVR
jgi:hypothetical protein